MSLYIRRKLALISILLLIFTFAGVCTDAQEIDPSLYSGLQWRLLGPFRGGRVTCVAGVAEQPNVYYFGTPGGGVWKTTDGGRVWTPIFDAERVASIGALAVAPSNPNIIYVATGEQTPGNGVYKSTDAGSTWTNIGLKDSQIITSIIVDPRDPNLVLVGVAGPFGASESRGVYKTRDGGRNWERVLFKDKATRIMDMNMSPDAPKVIYAALLSLPSSPPTPGQPPQPREQNAAIYKSTDKGSTWTQVEGKGFPSEPMGRVGVAVVPGSHGKKVFAIVSQGLFRSEDGGANWQRSTNDPRIVGSGYFSRVFVDPRNPDIVFVAQTSMYRSSDGGRTFEAFAGAPSGDDFHLLWINPLNDQNMIFGVDQGAIISVDGGKTWTSWYNQPTGQFYHVITDNHFPYYVYGAQQDSGTVGVASRSDYGEITYRDWAPVGGFEFSYIAPDPLHDNYIYAGGWYGSVLRYDKITGQIVHIFVRSPKYRTAGVAPVVFSPQDPHTLYVGAQYVLKSNDGGASWQEISPDLTKKPETQSTANQQGREGAGVISVLAPSTVQAGEIWAATSNGLVQVTRDGSSWENATPPNLPVPPMVRAIEASRHDPAEAYLALTVGQRRDLGPLMYRTRDFGKTWQLIRSGLPDSAIATVVREDPVRKGLLYAGTGDAIYISFDDGDHWQSLQLNLPTATITDITVHGDDVAISTFGRGLWILDDVTPLRQLQASTARDAVHLFTPAQTVRVRWDVNQDTPLPIETPAGKNPPDGAIIDYYLKAPPSSELKLTIYDSQHNLVREYAGLAPVQNNTPKNAPEYWFAPQPQLPKAAALNRFAWDLRYPPPKVLNYSYLGNRLDYIEYLYADHAIPGETPQQQPLGPLVVPGTYSVVLSVDGQTYRQELTVTADPRVHATQQDLEQQLDTAKSVSTQMSITYDGYHQLLQLAQAIADRAKALADHPQAKDATDALKDLSGKIASVSNGNPRELGLGPLNRELARLAFMIGTGDARPSDPLHEAVHEYCEQLQKRLGQWREGNQAIDPVNALLQKYNQPPLPAAATIPEDPACGSR